MRPWNKTSSPCQRNSGKLFGGSEGGSRTPSTLASIQLLLRVYSYYYILLLLNIINLSLITGYVAQSFKEAVIKPLLKKTYP